MFLKSLILLLFLNASITICVAQIYLSVENEKRMIRHKAYLGDQIKIKFKNSDAKISGTIDSLSMDGVIKMNGQLYEIEQIHKVYRTHIFRPNATGKKILGGFLAGGASLYIGGTIVNHWIIGTGTAAFSAYTFPLIVLGSGVFLMVKWKGSYVNGRNWKVRMLQK